ncbi:hypothetical protein ABEF92_003862 [Exophiala dermatitidis]|nr:hypothetical protein HRR75_004720 [Exophiala dermatitidis]KAJ4554397.1 hypothetical protein HRR78_002801 [Exophiala dermatitidis]
MGFSRLLTAVAAFLVLSTFVAAKDVRNFSQQAVPNTMADDNVDMSKVQKFKAIFSEHSQAGAAGTNAYIGGWGNTFNHAFKWTDLLDATTAATHALCSDRCLTCAPGCDPVCCTAGTLDVSNGQASRTDSADKGQSEPPVPETDARRSPVPGFRIPARLGCPCHCEAGCPPNVQAICCVTPGSGVMPPGGNSNSNDDQQATSPDTNGVVDGHNNGGAGAGAAQQKPIATHINARQRPSLPLACPCGCEASCPAYIQAICCVTAGSGAVADNTAGTGTSDDNDSTSNNANGTSAGNTTKINNKSQILSSNDVNGNVIALVTQTAHGDPVSVLASTNLSVFDSFVTMDLVNGLERASDIGFNNDLKSFEIVLTTAVVPGGTGTGSGGVNSGESQGDNIISFRHTFRVIDGSKLWEREQIMLGLGFLSRIPGAAVVDREFLDRNNDLGEVGVPVLTGTRRV